MTAKASRSRIALEQTIAQGVGNGDSSAIFEVVNPIP
jgi:hypothetical protein